MKLVAQVVAGNSMEVLDGCIEHHRELGVDAFVIVHVHSEDETPNRLRELAAENEDIHVIFADPEEAIRGGPLRESLDYARTAFDPDWILQIDCDERWFVRDRPLKEILSDKTIEALTIPRYNIVWPTPEDAQGSGARRLSIGELPIAAFPVRMPPDRLDTLGDIPWVLTRVEPKCCLRAQERAIFGHGGHQVLDRHTSARLTHESQAGILIAQLAFTTLERLEQKARFAAWCLPRWRKLYGGTEGLRWERLVNIAARGPEAVRAEWAKQFLSGEEARNLVKREVIVAGSRVFEATCDAGMAAGQAG